MLGTEVGVTKGLGGLGITNDGTKTTLLGISGDYLRIGDAATTGHSLASEDDLEVTGKLEVDGVTYLDSVAYIGDDANAKMTLGLTLNQGANDDEILAFKSSDIAHGVTDQTETDTYGLLKKRNATAGGLAIEGYSEDVDSFYMLGVATNDNTVKTTAALGVINFSARKKSGTGMGSVGINANLLCVLDTTTCRFIFDVEGDAHADVGWVAFKEHNDVMLLQDVESYLTSIESPKGTEHRHMLEEIGIIGKDSWHIEDGKPRAMINMTRLAMLHHGALLQLGQKITQLEEETRLLKGGKANASKIKGSAETNGRRPNEGTSGEKDKNGHDRAAA